MFKRRPHFISILSNIGRFLILLVIPQIRGLLVSLRGGFQFWLASAWMDIAVVVLIAAMGFAEWFCMGYCIDGGCLLFWQGILFRRVRRIPLDKISWASIVRPWYLRPLRAVEFRADTPGGSQNESDFTMLLYKSDAEYIFTVLDRLLPSLKAPPFAPREYRPRGFYVIILSALTSNSLAGILLASAAISRIGDLMGKEFSERIYGTLEQLARLAAFGVPPAAAALAYLLLGGWALAFLANLLRNKNLFVVRRANSFFIRGGLFTQRSYTLDLSQVNYLDIRQSVSTKALQMQSAFLHTAGYGKNKEDVSALIPAAHNRDAQRTLQMLAPELVPSPRSIQPNFGAIMKFLLDAVWCCILVPAASWLLCRLVPDWEQVIRYIGLIAMVPALWFLTVRILDFRTSGLSRDGDTFTLRYSQFFYLHTVVIPKERIVEICLRQSVLQWGDQKCDVLIYSRCEGRTRHHLKNLDRKECALLFDLPGYVPTPKKNFFALLKRRKDESK